MLKFSGSSHFISDLISLIGMLQTKPPHRLKIWLSESEGKALVVKERYHTRDIDD